ncbi:MAG: 50S ribosomal protein L11 methyltransferase [Ignavibacterium sp.]|nr:50S ribosomal protein L11 methyltransferase [Ignavibacterium sp.]
MIYKEFLITADPYNADLLSGILWELDITGLSEEVNCLKVFSSSILKNDIEVLLRNLVNNKMLRTFNVEENFIEEKNWNEEWEKSREIITISERIIIKPTFKDYHSKPGEIVLTIDPKMSFGTGEHQTTKMVLRLLENYIKPGMKVLDVGSGTGILAIAAVKLGADSVIANDIDEWCYKNSIENSELNDTTNKIDFRICTINEIEEDNFDLIIANIQKTILIEICRDFKTRIKQGGILILSGLLYVDEEDILQVYNTAGFTKIEGIQMEEWIAIVFKSK